MLLGYIAYVLERICFMVELRCLWCVIWFCLLGVVDCWFCLPAEYCLLGGLGFVYLWFLGLLCV